MVFPGGGHGSSEDSFEEKFGVFFFMVWVVDFIEDLTEKGIEFLFFKRPDFSSFMNYVLLVNIERV